MITVVGGTGRLGAALVPLLRSAGVPVRIASRSGVVPPALVDLVDDVVLADVRDPAALESVVRGSDVVVSAVHGLGSRERGITPRSVDHHGNAHLVDAAARAGADVVLVSVVGASPGGNELERAKWAAEVHLRGSGTRWTIVRATAYAELWSEIIAESATRDGRAVVLGRGREPVQRRARGHRRASRDRRLPGPRQPRSGHRGVGVPGRALRRPRPRGVRSGVPTAAGPRTVLRIVGQVARPVRPDVARMARMALWLDTADLRRADDGAVPARS